jgi:tetratricopeptide (TPR) repeat protein
MATLEQARRFQDPKVMEADRMLADQATRLRRPDLSEQYLRRIVSAGADNAEQMFTRRLVENLNSQGKFKDSKQFLSTIKSPVDKDVVLLLLSSDAERGTGDEKRAKELLDLAKANFGNDARVWIKSAQANMARPEYAQDVTADLNRAIQIDSRNAQLYEIRGGYLVRQGKVNEGIEDLQKAVSLNPSLSSLRMSLIRELLNRGRATEALTIGEDAVKNRGNDIQLAIELADVYYDAKQFGYAAKFYKQAWELNKTSTLTLRYLDAMLSAQPPMLADAEKVLKDRQADIDRTLELRLSRAKLQWKRGRTDDARADLKAAIDLIQPDQTQQLVLWFNTLSQVFPRPADRARQLDQFERDTPVAELTDWLLLLRGITFVEDPVTRTQGLDLYKQLVERSKNPQLRLMGFQRWSVSLYGNKEFDAAATVMTKGVREFPEDWELNNNLAFLLANELKRAKDALPYAEKTVKLRPDNTDSLDTLGTTYLALGDLVNAEQNLRKALDVSGRLQGQFSAAIHLCRVMIAKKDRAGADLVLADIDKMSKSAGDAVSDEQKKDIESLRTEVGSIQSR